MRDSFYSQKNTKTTQFVYNDITSTMFKKFEKFEKNFLFFFKHMFLLLF